MGKMEGKSEKETLLKAAYRDMAMIDTQQCAMNVVPDARRGPDRTRGDRLRQQQQRTTKNLAVRCSMHPPHGVGK